MGDMMLAKKSALSLLRKLAFKKMMDGEGDDQAKGSDVKEAMLEGSPEEEAHESPLEALKEHLMGGEGEEDPEDELMTKKSAYFKGMPKEKPKASLSVIVSTGKPSKKKSFL